MGSTKDQSRGRPSATQPGDNTAHNGDRGKETPFDHLPCVYRGFTHTLFHFILGTTLRNLGHCNVKTVLRVSLLGKAGTRTDKQSRSVFDTFVIFAGPAAVLLKRSAVFGGGG